MRADVVWFSHHFATPETFFDAILLLEIFFVLVVWPLFVPGLVREGCSGPPLMAYVGLLLLFALPLLLIAANVANVHAAELLRSQALVAGLAALGAGVAAP